MNEHNGPVLVIGATGKQGGAAARALLERGWEVRAFVRDPESPKAVALREAGARLVVGDLEDEDSLRAALDGVYGVFLMLTMMSGVNISLEAVAAEERHGRTVADLAAKAGVAHLVYSSLNGVDAGSGIEYYDAKEHIEDYIRTLGLPFTVLRPVSFMDNFATYNKPARDGDNLTLALAMAPETPMALIAVHDIGEFAAIAFERPDEFLGRTLGLAGDVLSPVQIAETLAATSGLTPRTVQIPIEQLRAFDEQVAKMFAWFNTHPAPAINVTALRALHPGLMTLADWVQATDWKL
ncbi:NmrA/HSCARG family protein [Nocardia sp. NBC_01503]|uniref:NmrA/HSCARG family protein n=1 Tax=Nocardia sp. NBC_01503 TaxID=2975997 RepID=UPI002E7C1FFC|nr:NmrA/HSCARG family protein [Nocardia sp. NBC_01503]WTL32832.1 NmrA/HSCARG family protein [Nocardia sp. NBC_01503]